MEIGPPLPAPYLVGVPGLPADLAQALGDRRGPTAAQVAEARRVVKRLKQLIRHARRKWELETDLQIDPEPPHAWP